MRLLQRLGSFGRSLSVPPKLIKALPRPTKVVLSVPGWISVELEPSIAEQKAAWSLYVEISTRVAAQPFNKSAGRLRAALSSLYSLFEFTRQILREAGPEVASGRNSLGHISIRFLTEIIAPFTTKWNEILAEYERSRPASESELAYEHAWERFDECCVELAFLQSQVAAYRLALGKLCSC